MGDREDVKQQVIAGRIGGKAKNPRKGFGSMDKALHAEISRIGGKKSKRGKKNAKKR